MALLHSRRTNKGKSRVLQNRGEPLAEGAVELFDRKCFFRLLFLVRIRLWPCVMKHKQDGGEQNDGLVRVLTDCLAS